MVSRKALFFHFHFTDSGRADEMGEFGRADEMGEL